MYTNIIFDLDGTLIDSLPGIANALNQAMIEQNLTPHDRITVRNFIGDGSYILCERAAINQSQATIHKLHQCFLKNYSENWKIGTQVFDGVNDLLKSLNKHSCTLHILSNKPHNFTLEIVDYLFPKSTFEIVLGQRQNIKQKPDPSGVYEILNNQCHPPKNTILIGDSTIDIRTASNANISSIGVTWGYNDANQIIQSQPDFVVKSPKELSQILLH